jgi:CubicO group peptidase (beta-lactamase class C family)
VTRSVVGMDGSCAAGYEAVGEVFAASEELGASLAVVVDGALVVDLARGWPADSIAMMMSVTKAFTATCAHLVLDDIDRPVASVWPEFASAGKHAITIAQLLDHTAALPAVREPLPAGTLYDWDAMCAALAAEEPWWVPGTRHGYHAVTFGFLVGEVVRRVTGQSVGSAWRGLVADRLDLDLWIGLPDAQTARVAELPPTEIPENGFNPFAGADPDSIVVRAFTNPADLAEPGATNLPRFRAAEIPAVNGIGDARSLARFYGALSTGEIAVPPRAFVNRVRGVDAVLDMEDAFALGFMNPSPMRPFSPNPNAFGHPGAGGALGFADLDRRLGFGYVPQRTLAAGLGGDPRWQPLIAAVYACVPAQ